MTGIDDIEQRFSSRAEREIGHAGGYAPGTTVICVAALHGNEPSGLRALRRVFGRIELGRISMRGELAGFAGNLAALAREERFLDEDMNRLWDRDRVRTMRSDENDGSDTAEQAEQRELLEDLHRVIAHARGPILLLDLHTASSTSPPFVVLGDTLRNREFARRFPIPIVLGLEEHIHGTLMEYLTGLGHIGVAVEGGRHDDPASVDAHESIIWLSLVYTGCLDAGAAPDLDLHIERLRRSVEGIPPILEITHRHPATPGFRMNPGYENFQKVRAGEVIAMEDGRPLAPTEKRRVFLPLYQSIGDDGFFLARPVNTLWLGFSSWLRHIGAPKLAPMLPGVSVHPELKNTLVVNLNIARYFAHRVFHLLGYRVHRPEDRRLLVEQRREDAQPSSEE